MKDLKSSLKKNKCIYSICKNIQSYMPLKMCYDKSYFQVIELKKQEHNKVSIENILAQKMVKVLQEALNYVPHYMSLGLGIKPKEINITNVYSVLNSFPHLDKKQVMENPTNFISKKFNKNKLYHGSSGGSTGIGVSLYWNNHETNIEKAFYHYEWAKAGYKNSSKIVRIGAGAKKRIDENPCEIIGKQLCISPYHINSKWIDEIANTIIKYDAKFIHAYPSSLESLIDLSKNNGKLFRNIKGVFLGSERITVKLLEKLNQLNQEFKTIFHYGLSERTNLALGEFNNGQINYKCDNIYGVSENLKNQDGFYEIVGTSRWNTIMPLIRYKTKDFGRIENGSIKNLDGRLQEFLITKQGNLIPGFSIDIDKFVWNYVRSFQVVQNERGKVEFNIVPKKNFTNIIGEKILNSQKNKWAGFFDLDIKLIESNNLTKSGKQRLVINNILQ